jgi:hypothetical protein
MGLAQAAEESGKNQGTGRTTTVAFFHVLLFSGSFFSPRLFSTTWPGSFLGSFLAIHVVFC